MERLKVGVFGGSGYGGSELLRLLLGHPGVELELVGAHTHAGSRVDAVHPNLRGLTSLEFVETKVDARCEGLDVLFLSLPHGESMKLTPSLPEGLKVVDLTGDFRLRDEEVFRRYYKREHTCFSLQERYVYGLTEVNREALVGAQRVANPGCFATCVGLGLYPLVKHGLTKGRVFVDAKTGSSGSGAKPSAGTHHPKRVNSFYAYKSFAHQHLPEILQGMKEVRGDWEADVVFQTHSAPMVRGIFATIYATLSRSMEVADVARCLEETYGEQPFVRLVGDGVVDVNWVKTTNFADIGFALEGDALIVFVAIDNLVKGAAGQAIQNMNLMCGLEETMGLWLPGTHP